MKSQLADPWVRCVGQDEQPAVLLGPCESGEEPLPEKGASVIDRNISRTAEAALRPDKVWALAGRHDDGEWRFDHEYDCRPRRDLFRSRAF